MILLTRLRKTGISTKKGGASYFSSQRKERADANPANGEDGLENLQSSYGFPSVGNHFARKKKRDLSEETRLTAMTRARRTPKRTASPLKKGEPVPRGFVPYRGRSHS